MVIIDYYFKSLAVLQFNFGGIFVLFIPNKLLQHGISEKK